MNIEKIVTAYLRDDNAVAALVERRIVAKTPDSLAEPWVRLTLLADPQDFRSQHDHLREFYLQLDCYAGATGGQPEALSLYEAVRAAILAIHTGDHTGATISAGRINGGARIPDTDLEPARERFVVTATVYAHPE